MHYIDDDSESIAPLPQSGSNGHQSRQQWYVVVHPLFPCHIDVVSGSCSCV